MSNIRRWLNEVPKTPTSSWPGPQTAPGQLGRPHSASCPGEFPQWLPPTSSEHSPNDTRSTESPTTHASDDQPAACESNTTVVPASSGSHSHGIGLHGCQGSMAGASPRSRPRPRPRLQMTPTTTHPTGSRQTPFHPNNLLIFSNSQVEDTITPTATSALPGELGRDRETKKEKY
ncbi:hypothetical protein Q7P36_000761 [Cladosporium allicinum]